MERVNYYWADFCENPERKKDLIHRQREDGIWELYDPITERAVISSTEPLDDFLL
jgi:hypothetical protein